MWPALSLFHSVNSDDLYIWHNCTQDLAAMYPAHCLVQTGSHEPQNKTSVLHTFGLRNTDAVTHFWTVQYRGCYTLLDCVIERLCNTLLDCAVQRLCNTFGLRNTQAV